MRCGMWLIRRYTRLDRSYCINTSSPRISPSSSSASSLRLVSLRLSSSSQSSSPCYVLNPSTPLTPSSSIVSFFAGISAPRLSHPTTSLLTLSLLLTLMHLLILFLHAVDNLDSEEKGGVGGGKGLVIDFIGISTSATPPHLHYNTMRRVAIAA